MEPRTLYRHFPTRDALIEAVYHTEVEKLAAAARDVAERLSPVEALCAGMFATSPAWKQSARLLVVIPITGSQPS